LPDRVRLGSNGSSRLFRLPPGMHSHAPEVLAVAGFHARTSLEIEGAAGGIQTAPRYLVCLVGIPGVGLISAPGEHGTHGLVTGGVLKRKDSRARGAVLRPPLRIAPDSPVLRLPVVLVRLGLHLHN
jgi:hypothetical protein